jgi:hypothetical protein
MNKAERKTQKAVLVLFSKIKITELAYCTTIVQVVTPKGAESSRDGFGKSCFFTCVMCLFVLPFAFCLFSFSSADGLLWTVVGSGFPGTGPSRTVSPTFTRGWLCVWL